MQVVKLATLDVHNRLSFLLAIGQATQPTLY